MTRADVLAPSLPTPQGARGSRQIAYDYADNDRRVIARFRKDLNHGTHVTAITDANGGGYAAARTRRSSLPRSSRMLTSPTPPCSPPSTMPGHRRHHLAGRRLRSMGSGPGPSSPTSIRRSWTRASPSTPRPARLLHRVRPQLRAEQALYLRPRHGALGPSRPLIDYPGGRLGRCAGHLAPRLLGDRKIPTGSPSCRGDPVPSLRGCEKTYRIVYRPPEAVMRCNATGAQTATTCPDAIVLEDKGGMVPVSTSRPTTSRPAT